MTAARDLVLDLGMGHGGAEVVARRDSRVDLLAQAHRLGGRLDLYLVLGLLILLDAEAARPVAVVDLNAVGAEGGVPGQGVLADQAGVFIGGQAFLVDLLALGIADDDVEGLVGVIGTVGLVVPGVAEPDLELDLVLGAIDRAIRHAQGLDLVVFWIVNTAVPHAGEAQVGEAIWA